MNVTLNTVNDAVHYLRDNQKKMKSMLNTIHFRLTNVTTLNCKEMLTFMHLIGSQRTLLH